jgi:hypothetical protein
MNLLIHTSKESDLDTIKSLINNQSNINLDEQDQDGYTALMYATMNENFNLVKYLLEKGANPNIYNSSSQHALFLSLNNSENKDIVDILAYYGSDLSKLNQDALSICFTNNYFDTAKCLLKKYYDLSSQKVSTLMLWATQYDKDKIIATLLDSGFDINARYNQEKFFDITLRLKHFKACKQFIDCGYEINTKENASTFIKALCYSSSEILECLFEQGLSIDKEAQNNKKNYLLLIKDKKSFEIALNNGFKVDELDVSMLIPNHAALAAIACIKGVSVKQTMVNKIMRKLANSVDFELINNLIILGYKLPDNLLNKVPQTTKDYAKALEEKEKFQNIIVNNKNNKRVKI